MAETTFTCDVRGKTTVLTVRGALRADACDDLEGMLEMCRFMRGAGPMIVDLAEVGELRFRRSSPSPRGGDRADRREAVGPARAAGASDRSPTSRATAAR